MRTLSFFLPSIVVAVIALGAVYAFGGTAAFVTAALLVVLEVTLSFDNAVVNAKVLSRMSPVWQRRFLTWGIVIAVIGTRLVLPILIVSAVTWASPVAITTLAFLDPVAYGNLLEGAHYAINSFGAAFLFIVALKYFMDGSKKTHWLRVIERYLSKGGRIESVEIGITLIILAALASTVPAEHASVVLIAGIIGVIVFIAMQGVTGLFSVSTEASTEAARRGLALFIYLNVLDSAFSLDSVVGAFALSSAIPVIVAGLGIGALFVRSLTVYLVRHKALDSIIYLEHGAHWAIFGLAASMFVSLVVVVPEFVTGTIGLAFVVAAYLSSLYIRRKKL
jgi:hypothetical protein